MVVSPSGNWSRRAHHNNGLITAANLGDEFVVGLDNKIHLRCGDGLAQAADGTITVHMTPEQVPGWQRAAVAAVLAVGAFSGGLWIGHHTSGPPSTQTVQRPTVQHP